MTFISAPSDGVTVTIHRETPKNQGASFTASSTISQATLEAVVDKLTLAVQELQRDRDLSLHIPVSDTVEPDQMSRLSRSRKLVGFDSRGQVALDIDPEDVRTIILANPVSSLTDVTDYGEISDPVEDVVDYGNIT